MWYLVSYWKAVHKLESIFHHSIRRRNSRRNRSDYGLYAYWLGLTIFYTKIYFVSMITIENANDDDSCFNFFGNKVSDLCISILYQHESRANKYAIVYLVLGLMRTHNKQWPSSWLTFEIITSFLFKIHQWVTTYSVPSRICMSE